MNSDSSKLFYDKYFELENRNIKLIIDNDKELAGPIVGFFNGDEENGEP